MGKCRTKAGSLKSIILAIILLTIVSCSSSTSEPPKYLSGQVIYTDKLIGADITVYNASGAVIHRAQNATGTEGIYTISNALFPESFTIVVTGGKTPDGNAFNGYLKRAVSPYEDNVSYEINGLTTLVAVYLERHPSARYNDAVMAVARYLSIPTAEEFNQASSMITMADAWFSDSRFWDEIIGKDYNAFINGVMQDIEAGKVVSFADESRTVDLPPLLNPSEWGFSEAKTMMKANKAGPAAIVLGIVEAVFEATVEIMDMMEEEANIETLNRIDDNINKIMAQLNDISAQLGRVESILREVQWDNTNDTLRNLELGCISPARTAFDNLIKFKKQLAGMTPAQRKQKETELNDKIKAFNQKMERRSCNGVAIDSFEDVLDIYANRVTRLDSEKDKSAIQLFANVVNTKSNNTSECADCNYMSIENTQLRFIYYQTVALQLYLHYELNKAENKGKIQQKKLEIINRFLKGPDEYGDERMIKQLRRFVPAVETFVVSHNNEPYYYRWLECDVMNAQQSGYHVNCAEHESPLLRSQIITDQLLGHIKDSSGAIAGGKYGLFIKAIQLKLPGVRGLSNKSLTIRMPNGSDRLITPVDSREIAGKNPYKLYGEPEDATWHVATYRIEDIGNPGTLAFELKHDNNDAATPIIFRSDISLRSLYNSNSSKYYNAMSLWTVPVRDVERLTLVGHNGFVWISLAPLTVFNCNNEKCDIYTTSFADWVPSNPSSLKFYKIGIEKPNVVIGYRTNGKRYIFLPDAGWEWIGLCANQQNIYAYNTLDIKGADGYSKIFWNMQSTGDDRYTFSRVNENNQTKYFVISNGLGKLYYGWSTCLYSSLNMVPTFSGEWR